VMNEQSAFQRILEEFPEIIETRCWSGFGDGWYGIVRDLCLAVRGRNEARRAAGEPEVHVLQIKEKLGVLRFYISCRLDEELRDLIRKAEEVSARTCDACGKPGTLRREDGIRTRCDECESREGGQHDGRAC
jgi:hypothetical protein